MSDENKKNIYYYQTKVSLFMEKDATGRPKFRASDVLLELSSNLDPEAYYKDGEPNRNGCQAVMLTLVQGMVSNLEFSHDQGYREISEHLEATINELRRATSLLKPKPYGKTKD
jgi:hypothetical protein